jgi:RimJ/RimL family protein N-acetyltransferase/GNAT superfamily N-acetyltransferase
MILETERLLLRPWRESDAESLYLYAKDDRIGPIAGWPPHTSVENSREIINTVLLALENYAVCLKGDDRAIGSIGLMIGKQSNIDLSDTEAEIGYWIGAPFWGYGLIPEATRELIRHAFVDLHLKTLWCGYFEGNEKSKRVQEKCGFKYHHTRKNIYWALMDDIRTEYITRLTQEEWKDSFIIRRCRQQEIPKTCDLALKVYSEFNAPSDLTEGIEGFKRWLGDEKLMSELEFYGAFEGDRLIGEVGIRPKDRHICLFSVHGGYHRLGVGRRLFMYLRCDYLNQVITLNAAPYALPFYKAIGFVETGDEIVEDGICVTPMKYVNNFENLPSIEPEE